MQCGSYVRAATPTAGFPWYAVGIRNPELPAVASALICGSCYNPLTLTQVPLALASATLGALAGTGPTHHLIGHPKGRKPIGAFEWTPLDRHNRAAAQQSMWSTVPGGQRTINTVATHFGAVIDQDRAKRVAQQRSKWFVNRNLRLTSQATAIAKTATAIHGGNGWNALQDLSDEIGTCIALYFNSTFGAVVRSAYGQSTHPGRAQIQINAIAGLPCPDFAADTPAAQHARDVAAQYFDTLASMELQPFAYCFRDTNRHQIDLVVAEMLGLNPADTAVHEMLEQYQEAPQVAQTTLL